MKLLHTRSKIFFPDPYVVRMEYGRETFMEQAEADYRKITRRAYRLIQGTWGHSKLEYEQVKTKDNDSTVQPPLQAQFNGINQQILAPLFISYFTHVLRGYICFENELDALQFRLSIEPKSIQVKMWPARWFTIHELVETDET